MLYNPPSGSTDPNAPYVGKNVAAGIQGSRVPPKAIELTQREIVNAELAAGLAPTNDDPTQLTQAIGIIGRGRRVSFASSQTWTVPANVSRIGLRIWGGGGGGGGAVSNSTFGNGGGGGGYVEGAFTVTPGQSLVILVGAPGVAGAPGAAGAAGGTTSVGALATATGGQGGQGSGTSSPGAGGTGAGGQINLTGSGGGVGFYLGSTGYYAGGIGGSSPFGGGSPSPNVGGIGIPGNFPGGAGNGASGNANGGAGAAGFVTIEY